MKVSILEVSCIQQLGGIMEEKSWGGEGRKAFLGCLSEASTGKSKTSLGQFPELGKIQRNAEAKNQRAGRTLVLDLEVKIRMK